MAIGTEFILLHGGTREVHGGHLTIQKVKEEASQVLSERCDPLLIVFWGALDLLSITEYVIKKGRPHGHRYGKLPENNEYHQAHNLKKRCIKRQFKGIHDRFLRDHVFRERMIQRNIDEEVCRAWDTLAEEDHTHRMSEAEYFHYRQNWWISLNKSGNDTQPVRKRSDFYQALST